MVPHYRSFLSRTRPYLMWSWGLLDGHNTSSIGRIHFSMKHQTHRWLATSVFSIRETILTFKFMAVKCQRKTDKRTETKSVHVQFFLLKNLISKQANANGSTGKCNLTDRLLCVVYQEIFENSCHIHDNISWVRRCEQYTKTLVIFCLGNNNTSSSMHTFR